MTAEPSTVLNDSQFAAQALAGGSTRSAQSLRGVVSGKDPGYAVGGKRLPDGSAFPERTIPARTMRAAVATKHLEAVRSAFGNDPTVHQGAWRENKKTVVLDASDVYQSKGKALVEGYKRGERAIYDIAKGADRPLARRAVS